MGICVPGQGINGHGKVITLHSVCVWWGGGGGGGGGGVVMGWGREGVITCPLIYLRLVHK